MKILLAGVAVLTLLAGPAAAQSGALINVSTHPALAPDGKARITDDSADDDHINIRLTTGTKSFPLKEINKLAGGRSLVDAIWSPDSQIAGINVSDGGVVGEWHAFLYPRHGDPQHKGRNVESLIGPYVRHFSHCEGGPEVNLGIVDWLKGGRQVVISASVDDHSLCSNMGNYKVFIVNTRSWRVVQIIPQSKAPKKWAGY